MKAFCIKCNKISVIVGYVKDDPKLSCGHIKQLPCINYSVECTLKRIQEFGDNGMSRIDAIKASIRESVDCLNNLKRSSV